jgi:hypothetical protein
VKFPKAIHQSKLHNGGVFSEVRGGKNPRKIKSGFFVGLVPRARMAGELGIGVVPSDQKPSSEAALARNSSTEPGKSAILDKSCSWPGHRSGLLSILLDT